MRAATETASCVAAATASPAAAAARLDSALSRCSFFGFLLISVVVYNYIYYIVNKGVNWTTKVNSFHTPEAATTTVYPGYHLPIMPMKYSIK